MNNILLNTIKTVKRNCAYLKRIGMKLHLEINKNKMVAVEMPKAQRIY